ncbi:MAG: hypothetical protein V4506_04870 [Bacteroidota bacterium]
MRTILQTMPIYLVVLFITTNSCKKKSTDAFSKSTSSAAQPLSGKQEHKLQTLFNNITPAQTSIDNTRNYAALPAHQIHVYLLVLIRF